MVTLTEPAGYLPYLFSMHATAPIPPNGDAPLGAAEGHTRDYGRFLVATGPTSSSVPENLDFSVPADEQTPVAGYVPGRWSARPNPNYDPATDGLRPAYPDGFNISIGGDNNDLYNKVQAGELDGVVDGIVPPPVLRAYSTDPTLQPLLHINPSDASRYMSFNWPSHRSTTSTSGRRSTSPWTRRGCGRSGAVSPSARSPATSW